MIQHGSASRCNNLFYSKACNLQEKLQAAKSKSTSSSEPEGNIFLFKTFWYLFFGLSRHFVPGNVLDPRVFLDYFFPETVAFVFVFSHEHVRDTMPKRPVPTSFTM